MGIKYDINNTYINELQEYQIYVLLGSAKTTTGQVSFTSTSSSVTYDTTGSSYDNQGQTGMMYLLKDTLEDFLITAANYNSLAIPGEVKCFASATPTTGYLKCNGAAVSRTTYAELFTSIGTLYGVGDGSTTFNVPDLRGEFIRGWADDSAVDTGRVFGSAQTDDVEPHSHGIYSIDSDQDRAVGAPNSGFHGFGGPRGIGGESGSYYTSGDGYQLIQNSTGTETRPRNIALLYCIRY